MKITTQETYDTFRGVIALLVKEGLTIFVVGSNVIVADEVHPYDPQGGSTAFTEVLGVDITLSIINFSTIGLSNTQVQSIIQSLPASTKLRLKFAPSEIWMQITHEV